VVAAAGLPVMGYAVIFSSWLGFALGVVIMLAGFYGWVLEPQAEEHPAEH
jgi:hypothetical protein